MLRSHHLFGLLFVLLASFTSRAEAFDLGDAVDSFLDELAEAAGDAEDVLCAYPALAPQVCMVAIVADDIIGEIADPTPCGAAGQAACLPIVDQKRFSQIGGPCELGLIEFPKVICVAPESAVNAVRSADDIARLVLALVEAYRTFKVQDPLTFINLTAAIQARDAERVQEIILDTQYFDEAFAIMRELGLKTATMSLSGGGFVLAGAVAEGGVALDTEIAAIPQVYHSRVSSIGIQAGAGVDLIVGGWVPSNCDIGGSATGRSVQVDSGPGVGSAIWFDDEGTFVGMTAGIGLIGVGGGVAKLIATTDVLGDNCEAPQDIPIVIVPPPGVIPEPAPEPTVRRITVAAGDTLWALCEAQLGDPFRYVEVFEANRPLITDPDLILPGQVLIFPSI
ncbi:MAG: LysM peptidoglycan-binding domain-containing protein [Yoonia sp.]|uniref:LysM peptidoglycan-binding domain-containing protein n=1 Tax=Yoonia sp. TaxID=2212373 RepID=UPI003EF63E6E